MATLSASAIARFSFDLLKQLSNPGDEGATAIDTVRLDLACDDAIAEFETECGVTFDVTIKKHVGAAVEGVLFYLKKRTGMSAQALQDERAEWDRLLKKTAQVTGRDKPEPATTSELTVPSEKPPGVEKIFPDTNRPAFDDLVPRRPI